MKTPISLSRLLTFLALLLAILPAQAEPLRLTSGVRAPYFLPDRQGFLDRLIPEVFRRIGVEAEAVQYDASARANINANSGIDDGVAMRVKGLDKNFPNLLRVEEKIIDNEFVAYALEANFATTGFDTLLPYQVAYITGWKVFNDAILPGTAVTRVPDAEQLFSLLANGRTDVVLFERWQGQHILRQRKLDAHMLLPPLVSTEMFMYLHRKHATLVGPAARALREMKADGSYQRILAETLGGPAER
jgi:polar amino acid transport system substrate-binding protein